MHIIFIIPISFQATIRMFVDLGLLNAFNIDYETLCRWLLTVKRNYRNETVQYHNWYHAFNVAQMMFCMLSKANWIDQKFQPVSDILEKCVLDSMIKANYRIKIIFIFILSRLKFWACQLPVYAMTLTIEEQITRLKGREIILLQNCIPLLLSNDTILTIAFFF